jgi:hypothetical protein
MVCSHARHFPTRLGTFPAGFGASPTMIHVVFRAFVSTRVANFRAELTDAVDEFRIPCHFVGGKGADIGTAPVEFDATRQHFHVVFLQARARTVFAFRHALLACGDTVCMFLVGHGRFLL